MQKLIEYYMDMYEGVSHLSKERKELLLDELENELSKMMLVKSEGLRHHVDMGDLEEIDYDLILKNPVNQAKLRQLLSQTVRQILESEENNSTPGIRSAVNDFIEGVKKLAVIFS